jgi:histidinol dehydrogenase
MKQTRRAETDPKMEVIRYPQTEIWPEILRRPTFDLEKDYESVRKILEDVRSNGDTALRNYTKAFDRVELAEVAVNEEEFGEAENQVSDDLKSAIRIAKTNIEMFHRSQIETVSDIETAPGVLCWRKPVAIEKVGLYVPGGTAPLFSTVLMLGVPATLAGCREIVLCTPPDADGRIANEILYAARECGITKVFKVGGAQAIGAMAYGTEAIPKVYKIFGPGNRFVTCAKQIVSQGLTAIDMPAGPSEVAILADESCIPAFVAADLLSQAEHGTDSQVIFVTTSKRILDETLDEIARQLPKLSRREIAEKSLESSKAILMYDVDGSMDLLNEYASEHLILAVEDADVVAEKVINAGSVFLGNYSCESAGDYASGTNHTLPTGGHAKAFGGVSVDSFVKKITFQKLTANGMTSIGPAIEKMAEAEGLDAHKNAVSIRLKAIAGGGETA